jgi:protein-S-isoprenylcysteine O-methyltransferase Ste14
MRLVANSRRCWRWFSVQMMALGTALSGAYGAMYEQLKESVPPDVMAALTALVFVAGIFGRLVAQAGEDDA